MGAIVVGVDESEGARDAFRWAVHEAELRGWTLTALMAWSFLDQHHASSGVPFDPHYGEAEAWGLWRGSWRRRWARRLPASS